MASRGSSMSYIPLFQPAPVTALSPSSSSGSNKTTVPLGPSSSLSSSMSSIWAPVTPNSANAQWPDAPTLVSPRPTRAPPMVTRLDTGQDGYVAQLKVTDGADKIKAAIEHSQHAVVEQLLRSLHIDSPEPVVDSAAPTPVVCQPRRWSPDPLSASSASSPSALATPDNLSPMLAPTLDDYFAAHQSQFMDQPLQVPVTPPNMNQFDHVGLYTPTKPLRSSQSQAQLAQQEFMARNARGRSLSATTTQSQGFSPFVLPTSSPSSQNVLFHSHPLPQDQQQQQPMAAHDFTTIHRSQFRHVSMPNALSHVSPPVQDNWIHTSGPAGVGLPQQQPVFQNPFAPHILQQQVATSQYSPTSASTLAPQAQQQMQLGGSESINFLRLLQPSSQPPYDLFVQRIVRSSDQQASIFLQQKLKVADAAERTKIIDAIASKGFEMMTNRFGNWCCQRVWEYPEERAKLVACMRGRVVDIATNCYGTHVLQKALDCDDETRLVIVSELLLNDPASTLVNKHASHVFSKIMEINWKDPAPPIFSYFHNALRGKWASLACHETGSLVVQHVFENVDDEDPAKDEIVCELITGFGDIVKNQFGAFCVQHLLEHGSPKHRSLALDQLMEGLLEYASHEQGVKSIQKALKEGGTDILDRVCKRMCEPPLKGGRRSLIVDLALNPTGSQLIANILPNVNKEQRTMLYEAIRRHVVTLRGSKTGSKTVWLFDRMRAYYGFGPGN